MKTFSFYWHDELEQALKEAAQRNGPYNMSLTSQGEIQAVIAAVNQGIDSHLEACYIPDRGDRYEHGKRTFKATSDGPTIAPETKPRWLAGEDVTLTTTLECLVSPESLLVLVRRLMEMEETEDQREGSGEGPMSLASSIFSSLDIEVV